VIKRTGSNTPPRLPRRVCGVGISDDPARRVTRGSRVADPEANVDFENSYWAPTNVAPGRQPGSARLEATVDSVPCGVATGKAPPRSRVFPSRGLTHAVPSRRPRHVRSLVVRRSDQSEGSQRPADRAPLPPGDSGHLRDVAAAPAVENHIVVPLELSLGDVVRPLFGVYSWSK
jgi:hypothetical protein